MVHSKLHVICGNCGALNDAQFHIDPEGHDVSDDKEKFEPAVFIVCKNCTTLHDLSDFIEQEAESKQTGSQLAEAQAEIERLNKELSDIASGVVNDGVKIFEQKKIIEQMCNALKIISENCYNPHRTMTLLGLEEVTEANYKLAKSALIVSERV